MDNLSSAFLSGGNINWENILINYFLKKTLILKEDRILFFLLCKSLKRGNLGWLWQLCSATSLEIQSLSGHHSAIAAMTLSTKAAAAFQVV